MKCCEIRIPTYNRPELLLRAIKSLQAQDYPNWKAIIFDDSRNEISKNLIYSLNDHRLIYRLNQPKKGAAENINQCFITSSYLNCDYVFVLEDDNYLFPTFISQNIKELDDSKTNILLRNQKIDIYTNLDNIEKTNHTTRGGWFKNRIYSPFELHTFLFFFEGISNGGLFWNSNAISDFVVNETSDVGLQENFRTLHIQEPVYFANEPLAVFTSMDKSLTARASNKDRFYSRGRQAIVRKIIKRYGYRIVDKAKEISQDKKNEKSLEITLLDAFYFKYDFQIPKKEMITRIIKSIARFIFIKQI
jgi:glycosyltransferase involved in cell wall biosynthesis